MMDFYGYDMEFKPTGLYSLVLLSLEVLSNNITRFIMLETKEYSFLTSFIMNCSTVLIIFGDYEPQHSKYG